MKKITLVFLFLACFFSPFLTVSAWWLKVPTGWWIWWDNSWDGQWISVPSWWWVWWDNSGDGQWIKVADGEGVKYDTAWSSNTAWSVSSWYSPCRYSEWASLWTFLNGCKPKTVVGGSDMTVEWGFKSKINKWIVNLSVFLWVMAVGSLVYAAFLMQISGGADEDIKKGKNIVKNTILWFLALIMASGIVYLVINVMFWLWS